MKNLKKLFISAAVLAAVFGGISCTSKSASAENEGANADSVTAAEQEQAEEAIADSIAAEAAKALVLNAEGLPSVTIGMAEKDIPASVEGVYDSTKSRSLSQEYDMTNPGLTKEITCMKDGQDVLFVYLNAKGEVCGMYVSSPELSTTDGLHVGSPVSDVKKVNGLKYELNEMEDTQSYYGNGFVYRLDDAGNNVCLIGVGTTL